MDFKNVLLTLSLIMISSALKAEGPSYNFYFNSESTEVEKKDELDIKEKKVEKIEQNKAEVVKTIDKGFKRSRYSNWAVHYQYSKGRLANSKFDLKEEIIQLHRVGMKYYLRENIILLGFANFGEGLENMYASNISGFGVGIATSHLFLNNPLEHRLEFSKNYASTLYFASETFTLGEADSYVSSTDYSVIEYSVGPKFILDHFELGAGLSISYMEITEEAPEINTYVSSQNFQFGLFANASYRF